EILRADEEHHSRREKLIGPGAIGTQHHGLARLDLFERAFMGSGGELFAATGQGPPDDQEIHSARIAMMSDRSSRQARPEAPCSVAPPARIERATLSLGGRCSIH